MKIPSITKIAFFIIELVGISDRLVHIKREHVHNGMYVLSFRVKNGSRQKIVKNNSKKAVKSCK